MNHRYFILGALVSFVSVGCDGLRKYPIPAGSAGGAAGAAIGAGGEPGSGGAIATGGATGGGGMTGIGGAGLGGVNGAGGITGAGGMTSTGGTGGTQCVPNQPCAVPNMPCKNGTTLCTSGLIMCSPTTNKGPGTPCGPVASCVGGTKTEAAVCDSAGSCPAPSTIPCMYGCNPGATDCLPPVFGSPCQADGDCAPLGSTYTCLKTFQALAIPTGLCTRPCDGTSRTDCTEMMGACVSETSGLGHDPLTACFPTCKADVPCRTGFNCNFVYMNNMLVEPSVCVPQ
jgi:hypothetical protein